MKIKVGITNLPVKNFYPFRYSDGKMVLRFEVKQSDMDFQELRELLQGNQNPIEFYQEESNKPACIYYGYSEFTAQYERGKYCVEQITPSTLQSAVEALQAKIKEQEAVLFQQTEVIQNQSIVIDTLTESVLGMSMEVYSDQGQEVEKEDVSDE